MVFPFFLSAASLQPSYSTWMTFVSSGYHVTISVEDSTASGKWSFLPGSTFISHLRAACRRFFLAWLLPPLLFQGVSAANALSWRHLCRDNEVLHPAIVPLPPLNPHSGSSLILHWWKFTGKVLYTAWRGKVMQKGSSRHSSLHKMVLLGRFFLVQAPY